MKIVIDLQGAQGKDSQNRGIGRYSLELTEEIARQAGTHDVWLVLNGGLPTRIDDIRRRFKSLVPESQIRVWQNPLPVHHGGDANSTQRRITEKMREAFIRNLKPDVVHVSSLFEGFSDQSVTSVGTFDRKSNVSITLFDLIPFVFKERYLAEQRISDWYFEKINHLRSANVWMAISHSARTDAIDRLGLPKDQVFNISAAADSKFTRLNLSADATSALRAKYNLTRPFLLYTGGMDWRKNIKGLIEAYSLLPAEVRTNNQLAVVCAASENEKHAMASIMAEYGLGRDECIFTGFVDDSDLIALYNICTIFVFPSLYEGFGLPVLEAMQCGAPVITSNTSSLPEIVVRADAMFDPLSVTDMSRKMFEVLSNVNLRDDLVRHSAARAAEFSWSKSATKCIGAWEASILPATKSSITQVGGRRRLAFVSPMPPQKSGIADFSAEIIPEIAKYYDIEIIIDSNTEVAENFCEIKISSPDYLINNFHKFDRILYQFGNSDYHNYMFDLLRKMTGVVDLHDFFLSGVLNFRQNELGIARYFDDAIQNSHGIEKLKDKYENTFDFIANYPCNLDILQDASGVILHSDYAMGLVQKWYPNSHPDAYQKIPLARLLPGKIDKAEARRRLGYADDTFLVGSFGGIAAPKRSDDILDAWLASANAMDPKSKLLFVGNDSGRYCDDMKRKVHRAQIGSVEFVGSVDMEMYRLHLNAVDCAVQLRGQSRGETSASVLDCMAHALPVILNANGSMAEFPRDAVLMLSDEFEKEELISALTYLNSSKDARDLVGESALRYIQASHSPKEIAKKYFEMIEYFYECELFGLNSLISSIKKTGYFDLHANEQMTIATALAENFPPLFNR